MNSSIEAHGFSLERVLQTRTTTAFEALRGRLLIAAGSDARAVSTHLDDATSGLVLVGPDAAKDLRKLRAAFPELPLLVDRCAYKNHVATSSDPFFLAADAPSMAPLVPMPLEDVVEQQLSEGATMAVLPMGFLQAGDASPLRAAIGEANEKFAPGSYLLVVPAAPAWLSRQNVGQFIAILKTSSHPVAIALNDQKNPLDEKDVVSGYRRVFTEVENAVPWLTDHNALGAIAHGAAFGVFGFRASHRHISVVGETSRTPEDKHPHVYIPDLMLWGKASNLRKSLFATQAAPPCYGRDCAGLAPDRFRDHPDDIFAGGVHNVLALASEHSDMMSADETPEAWWYARLSRVTAATNEFATRVQRRVKVPADVQNWLAMS